VFSGTLRDDRARQFETLWGEGAARSRDVERRPARRGVNVGAALVAFVPGLAVGSFLNVVTSRLPAGRSIVRPRSACPSCEAPIAARDNIPVISYVLLRGRCRSCGAPISWKYPVVELLTASLIAACALVYGFTFEAAIAAFFCTVLVAVSVTDIERFVIPNRIVVPAAAVVLVAQTINEPSAEWVVAGFGAALFLFVAALVYPAGMGMGDVKLALLLGFMLGRTVPVALMVGTIAALVPSIVLIARHGSAARKMRIPFGPFLAFGGIVALFFGDAIVDAYLGML
jgi:leader peptidase (prepilin peptidase)/N-methyltransferase